MTPHESMLYTVKELEERKKKRLEGSKQAITHSFENLYKCQRRIKAGRIYGQR